MTRDECVKVLQALWRYKDCEYSEHEVREALEIAIQALKKEKRTALHENKVAFNMAIKALLQEPCEYAPFTIDELKNEDTKKLLREFKNQRVTTKEPREDEISREWLKTAIHNFYYGLKHIPTEEDIQAYIDIAPHVTPKEKTDSLEKIRAEIDDATEIHSDGEFYIKNIDVKRIIDKYKAESEG